MFASFFGSSEGEEKPEKPEKPRKSKARMAGGEDEDEQGKASSRETHRRKAAAEARKKRDADGPTLPSGFVVGKEARPSSKGIAKPPVLKSISEDDIILAGASQPSRGCSAVADADLPSTEELQTQALRVAAAQEKAVADLMRQASLQQEEDKANAVRRAIEETEERMRAAAKEELESVLATRLAEAEAAAATVKSMAVEQAKAEALCEAEAKHAKELARAEARHEAAREEALAAAVAEVEARLGARHEATLAASASLLRKTQIDVTQRIDESMQMTRQEWERELIERVNEAVALANLEAATSQRAAQDKAEADVRAAREEAAAEVRAAREEAAAEVRAAREEAAAEARAAREEAAAEAELAREAAEAANKAGIATELAEQKRTLSEAFEKERGDALAKLVEKHAAEKDELSQRLARANKVFKNMLHKLVEQPHNAISIRPAGGVAGADVEL